MRRGGSPRGEPKPERTGGAQVGPVESSRKGRTVELTVAEPPESASTRATPEGGGVPAEAGRGRSGQGVGGQGQVARGAVFETRGAAFRSERPGLLGGKSPASPSKVTESGWEF